LIGNKNKKSNAEKEALNAVHYNLINQQATKSYLDFLVTN